jgi:hypothetical protein
MIKRESGKETGKFPVVPGITDGKEREHTLKGVPFSRHPFPNPCRQKEKSNAGEVVMVGEPMNNICQRRRDAHPPARKPLIFNRATDILSAGYMDVTP